MINLPKKIKLLTEERDKLQARVQELESNNKEAVKIITELCSSYSHPLPEATIARLEAKSDE